MSSEKYDAYPAVSNWYFESRPLCGPSEPLLPRPPRQKPSVGIDFIPRANPHSGLSRYFKMYYSRFTVSDFRRWRTDANRLCYLVVKLSKTPRIWKYDYTIFLLFGRSTELKVASLPPGPNNALPYHRTRRRYCDKKFDKMLITYFLETLDIVAKSVNQSSRPVRHKDCSNLIRPRSR